jgi:16S rRNA (uracil1498-N3)-methyltransferase
VSLPRLRLENSVFQDGIWIIDEQEARHLVKVRRCYNGSLVEGLLGGRKIELKLICDGTSVRAKEVSQSAEPAPYPEVHLLLALLKADQFDLSLRFAAELGVYAVHLLSCVRSVPRYEEGRANEKMKRWRKILDEATKQAGSTHVPILHEPVALSRLALDELPRDRFAALLSDEARPMKKIQFGASAAVAIGPEGDWDPSETAFLLENGFAPVSLGKRILRASTAVAAACSWFMLAAEQSKNG